jgi:hypothetical protein
MKARDPPVYRYTILKTTPLSSFKYKFCIYTSVQNRNYFRHTSQKMCSGQGHRWGLGLDDIIYIYYIIKAHTLPVGHALHQHAYQCSTCRNMHVPKNYTSQLQVCHLKPCHVCDNSIFVPHQQLLRHLNTSHACDDITTRCTRWQVLVGCLQSAEAGAHLETVHDHTHNNSNNQVLMSLPPIWSRSSRAMSIMSQSICSKQRFNVLA